MIERLQSFTTEDEQPCAPRVCRLDSESATTVIDAIASDTARSVLATLHDEPQPVSQLAEKHDMSIPAVDYHLEKLEDAGLIGEVDTWYSSKGTEMVVYGPTDDPLVFVGDDEQTDLVRLAAARVGALVLGIAAVSVLVQWVVTDVLPSGSGYTMRKAAAAGTVETASVMPLPPGLLFFSGGTFVLAVGLTVWYLWARTRRTATSGDRAAAPNR